MGGLTLLVVFFLSVFDPPGEGQIESFRLTAPCCLTNTSAREHLLAARAAGLLFHESPEFLLAIAHHESRYQVGVVTSEPGRRVSCGVMTPVPQRGCSRAELTLHGGYESGAKHVAMWRTKYKSDRAVLLAYAGGGGLVRACAPRGYFKQRGKNVCDFADVVMRRRNLIHRAITGTRTSQSASSIR